MKVAIFNGPHFIYKDNIKEIHKSLSPNTRKFSRYLTPFASQMNTERDYDWVRNLTETNKEYFKDAKIGVDQSLETVRLNMQWQKKHMKDIKKLLKENEH